MTPGPAILAAALAALVGTDAVAQPRPAAAQGRGAAVERPVPRAEGARVLVSILSKHAPAWIAIEGPRRLVVRADAAGLVVDGAAAASLALPEERWRLRGEGFDRSWVGALSLRARAGVVEVRLEQPLEAYVADVVAAESEPGTPPAALRALAVVARSFAFAATGRHEGGALCDLAHCQITAGRRHDAPGTARAAAEEAARATAGRVLLVDGAVAQAPFHAACGGHTADPVATFGGADRTGAAPVADGCGRAPWEATLPRGAVEAAARALLGPGASIDRLRWERGPGDFVEHVVDPASGRSASGEAFARTLDRAAGWGVIRSPRFRLEAAGSRLRLHGGGHGHGVGLCQAGAARLAESGLDHEAILARYFPGAVPASLPPGGH